MGNYGPIPKNPPLAVNWSKHEFEAKYVQRVKETPFVNAQVYSLEPPIFIDETGPRLGSLLEPRLTSQQLFPPEEVIRMMESVVTGLAELEEQGFEAHGDISFESIYYDKRKKLFKITHPAFNQCSGYEHSKLRQRFSFLSPEQLLALTDPYEQKQSCMSLKSDLFSLGILMCEVATMTPSAEVYCPETYNIFDLEIQNRLELIEELYPDPLACQKMHVWFKELLQYDENDRKSPTQLRDLYCQLQVDDNSRLSWRNRDP